ncbi:hypothetical protein GCM10023184_26090 [Flaviaesturariibacter amylovorans]|uniref:Uncharacterized protein n=1 Tax=Flaviaesturariibacter amylovorans TaxID=1084520 RepID=A0ABP8H1P2_9BACT
MLAGGGEAAAQKRDKPFVDSTAYYDDLFDDMEEFLDSVTAPRTFFLVNIGVNDAYFNYEQEGSFDLLAKRQLTYTPSVGYYHKGGLGLNLSATVVNDGTGLNAFQYLATASYDYFQQTAFATGINYTRYFTRRDLPFYTTPLQNEVGAYFTYKRWWVKPAVFVSYGWGSREEYAEREAYITSLRLRPDGFTRVRTNETISDFSLSLSARHDFWWLNVGMKHASLRITPQVVFTSGTQKFGFNQNANTYGVVRATNLNELIATENQSLDDQLYFQPLSLAGFLRVEYSWKRIFLQPQYVLNYYFPAGSRNFLGLFRFNVGMYF